MFRYLGLSLVILMLFPKASFGKTDFSVCSDAVLRLSANDHYLLENPLPNHAIVLTWEGADLYDLRWQAKNITLSGDSRLIGSEQIQKGLQILRQENGELRLRRSRYITGNSGSGFYFDTTRRIPVAAFGHELFTQEPEEDFLFEIGTVPHEFGHLIYWHDLKIKYGNHPDAGLLAWKESMQPRHLLSTEDMAVRSQDLLIGNVNAGHPRYLLSGHYMGSSSTYPEMVALLASIESINPSNIDIQSSDYQLAIQIMTSSIQEILDIRSRASKRILKLVARIEDQWKKNQISDSVATTLLVDLSNEYWRLTKPNILDVITLSFGGIEKYTKLTPLQIEVLKLIYERAYPIAIAKDTFLNLEINPSIAEVNREINRIASNFSKPSEIVPK